MTTLRSILASALATTLTVGLLAFGLSALTAAPAQAASPASKYGTAAEKATNRQRAKHDRVKLKASKCLKRYAKSHARKMARKRAIWHQDLGKVLSACDMRMVGENVAAGYRTGRSVVNQGWMKSPGHRENILRREYRRSEVAAVKGEDGRWYAAQLFGRY
ncbi:CAP domain-containing protein [Nocardioides gilvus]|uniref:CAP domain-containing protein n=1 Tax=Nocardioides gilvus TaxID=1735589 RepID=UPI0013A5591D|nr:CAP domain-containing protein [Nocardioides gilvus]